MPVKFGKSFTDKLSIFSCYSLKELFLVSGLKSWFMLLDFRVKRGFILFRIIKYTKVNRVKYVKQKKEECDQNYPTKPMWFTSPANPFYLTVRINKLLPHDCYLFITVRDKSGYIIAQISINF